MTQGRKPFDPPLNMYNRNVVYFNKQQLREIQKFSKPKSNPQLNRGHKK